MQSHAANPLPTGKIQQSARFCDERDPIDTRSDGCRQRSGRVVRPPRRAARTVDAALAAVGHVHEQAPPAVAAPRARAVRQGLHDRHARLRAHRDGLRSRADEAGVHGRPEGAARRHRQPARRRAGRQLAAGDRRGLPPAPAPPAAAAVPRRPHEVVRARDRGDHGRRTGRLARGSRVRGAAVDAADHAARDPAHDLRRARRRAAGARRPDPPHGRLGRAAGAASLSAPRPRQVSRRGAAFCGCAANANARWTS